jgi:hypothetical protein
VSAQAGGTGQMTRLRVSQLSRQVFSFDLGRISTLAQADVQIDIGGVGWLWKAESPIHFRDSAFLF